MSGWKQWTRERLTSVELQDLLQDQVVMGFASASARTAQLGAAASEAMVSHLADTDAIELYDGTRWLSFDSKWQTRTPRLATGTAANFWTQGNGTAQSQYFRTGRKVRYKGLIAPGSTSSFAGGNTSWLLVDFPPGLAPAQPFGPGINHPLGVGAVYNGNSILPGLSGMLSSTTPADRRVILLRPSDGVFAVGVGGASSFGMGPTSGWFTWDLEYETAFEA